MTSKMVKKSNLQLWNSRQILRWSSNSCQTVFRQFWGHCKIQQVDIRHWTGSQLYVSHPAVIRQSSGGHPAVIRQSSRSHPAVIPQSSGSHLAVSHQAVIRQSSGNHLAVIWQSSGSHLAVIRQSSGSLPAVTWQSSSLWQETY